MIKLIVGLLINFPKIGKIFLKIIRAYEKEVYKRQHNSNDDLIDDWVFNPKPFSPLDKDPLFYLETESPLIRHAGEDNDRRDTEVRERS